VRIALLLVAISVVAGLSVAPAAAHDHTPPKVTLEAGNAEQPGTLISSCWIRGKDLGGAALCRQTETTFPEPVDARRPEATLDLRREAEPRRVRLRAWRRLRPSGEPRAPAKRLDVELGQLQGVWLASFTLPRRPGTWYLEAKGVWPDRAFPDSEQFGVWTFAVRTS
jgi:hypothetical protein